MREIKFRAYSKATKKMFNYVKLNEKGLVNFCWNGTEKKVDSMPGTKTEDDCIPLQYTRLKDKNGKEIYEGDIVKIKTRSWDCEKEVGKWDKEIVWIKCDNLTEIKAYFDLEAKNKWDNGWSYEDWCDRWEENKNIEVIGNIYENKDLLNSQN